MFLIALLVGRLLFLKFLNHGSQILVFLLLLEFVFEVLFIDLINLIEILHHLVVQICLFFGMRSQVRSVLTHFHELRHYSFYDGLKVSFQMFCAIQLNGEKIIEVKLLERIQFLLINHLNEGGSLDGLVIGEIYNLWHFLCFF